MSLKFKLAAAAVSVAAAVFALNAHACSTVIVGKDVSATGEILIGHNEDNGGRILSAQYWVPAADHKAGEMLKFEPANASIPQVAHTLGFYWSQTFDPTGASFSDGFFNEAGVAIVSNACTGIYEENVMPLTDGGVGYGIRRLMAERATSARHAVEIAIDLLKKYGYNSEGRTYTVADGREAWQIAIHQGNTWAARKVKDNEVVYIPNNFMMQNLDPKDPDVILAPGMIERAIKNGRYKPAKAGDYSDFNFRLALQPAERRAADYNQSRNSIAWKKITGQEITDPEKFPYSVTPNKKFTVEDVQAILRSHEKDIGDDPGWFHHKGLGLCRPTTHESVVYQMRENPLLTAGWRAMARPCETAYVPFYPAARPAEHAGFLGWKTATAEQFKGTPEHFSYSADWPVWSFITAANVLDYQRDDQKANTAFVKGMEKHWRAGQKAVEAKARALLAVSPEKAAEFLHAYNVQAFNEAAAKTAEHNAKIAPHAVSFLVASIDPKSEATADVVLYSDKTLDATKIDVKRTYAGVSRATVGTKGLVSDLAQPVKTTVKDVNGDGLKDIVLTFKQKDLGVYTFPGAVLDMYVYTFDKAGKRVTAFDPVYIETEGYKGAQKRTEGADV